MKTIRMTSMALLLMFSVLSISVMRAGGQVQDSSSTAVRIAPANEDFAVWMPDSPQLVGAEQMVVDQRPLTLNYYCLIKDGTEYAVLSISGLEDKMGDLAHMLMLNLYSKLIPNSSRDQSKNSEVAIKANYQRDISVSGYAGREFSIQAHKRTGLWRFYSVGRKFYAVAASTTRPDNILINSFLNSFALSAPTSAIVYNEPVQSEPNPSTQAPLPARPSSTDIQTKPVQSQPNTIARATLPARSSSKNIQKKPVQSQPKTSAQGTPPARSSSTDVSKAPVQAKANTRTLPARPSLTETRKEPVQSQSKASAQATLPTNPSPTEIKKEPVQSQPKTSAPVTLPARPSPTETWLIILSTFSKAERSKANEKVRLFRSLGYDAHLVETDNYPNLRKGLLAVAIGPHSKSAALAHLNKVRSVAPDSYIKPGW